MQRFSFPHLSLGKDIIISEAPFVHQISRVLRYPIGENVVLFNGDGQEYVYSIRSIDKKNIALSFERSHENEWDTETIVRLYQALSNRYEKIEYILQKGVEVWIREFIFFRSDRSQKLAIHPRKIERFQEIAREATEQCSGNRMPSIVFLESGIPVPENGISYMLHTEKEGSIRMHEIDKDVSPINIFIGPEGGWSPGEISVFKERDIRQIHLWSRILRTETTGPVVAFHILQR